MLWDFSRTALWDTPALPVDIPNPATTSVTPVCT
jgi:hypothetical protein